VNVTRQRSDRVHSTQLHIVVDVFLNNLWFDQSRCMIGISDGVYEASVADLLSMTYFWYFCIYKVSPLVS